MDCGADEQRKQNGHGGDGGDPAEWKKVAELRAVVEAQDPAAKIDRDQPAVHIQAQRLTRAPYQSIHLPSWSFHTQALRPTAGLRSTMWAWRSLLSRPHPLRAARRHANQMAAVLGRNGLIRSRGYASDSNGDPGAEVATKRHLYVVLDDCRTGYGIHKLDMDDDGDGEARSLPEPPVLRVALPSVRDRTRFAAVGSSIVAISPKDTFHSGGVLIYDTKSAAQIVTRSHPVCLDYEAAMAVGGRLYMFGDTLRCLTAEHCGGYDEWDCEWKRHRIDSHPDPEEWYCSESRVRLQERTSPGQHDHFGQHDYFRTEWSCWKSFVKLPFRAGYVTAHAVHAPPEQAAKHDLFVSVSTVRTRCATYSFSTALAKWTRLGTWQLPVIGHAHYDGELGAWLGLNAAEGRLCAGDITSAPATWKVGREKLLGEHAVAAAMLVPMAPSEYCLVEQINGFQFDRCDSELRLTTFRVGRGQDGAPVVTSRRPARCYKFSKYSHNTRFAAQAFWM